MSDLCYETHCCVYNRIAELGISLLCRYFSLVFMVKQNLVNIHLDYVAFD